MLTDPFSPAGYSYLKYIVGVSERYIIHVNGFIFINVAAVLETKWVRLLLFRFSLHIL